MSQRVSKMPYYWKWLLEARLENRAYVCGQVGFQAGSSLEGV